MIVSNSALDMRSVVVHVLSEALNRYSVCATYSVCVRVCVCVWYRYFRSVSESDFVYVCFCASYFFSLCVSTRAGVCKCSSTPFLRALAHMSACTSTQLYDHLSA